MMTVDKILLVSPDDVKAESQINYNVDDGVVGQTIKVSQNTYLREIIGERLLVKIKTLIYNGLNGNEDNIDAEANEVYKTILEDYVMPYLVAKVNAEICLPISLKIRNIGVAQDSDTNIAAAQLENIKYLRKYYETMSCDKATILSEYLSTLTLDELEPTCACRKDNLVGKRFANTDLYLG